MVDGRSAPAGENGAADGAAASHGSASSDYNSPECVPETPDKAGCDRSNGLSSAAQLPQPVWAFSWHGSIGAFLVSP